ncbi:sterol desaturase family protein [Aliikangiella coralliicola]|uniref:Sterol desaturase family protein n=1 Tax=Aliikangiella coralliicola TaxID=2592383 RepID=A0A545UI44_9GAMM|nr:sterol desaturase family protein [Aliikangiella coralliicola]TQV89130.1 sterol desaturase family protein [Aliikangiella coralliicola]
MNPNNLEQNQAFRRNYRETQISASYKGWLHLSFTLTFAIGIVIIAISQLESVTSWEYLTIPITFIYANLVEYFVHKGPMHRPFKGLDIIYKRHATQHHIFFTDQFMRFDSTRDFKAVLFPPMLIAFFLVFFALPAGLLIRLLFTANICYLFVVTAFSYFALYEILHTTYHVRSDSWIYRLPFLKSLRQLHQDHHRLDCMAHNNFNITFPIGDWIFGTYYRGPKEPGLKEAELKENRQTQKSQAEFKSG